MCARQNSPTARQPDSPTARQPDSPTARQPDSPTARHYTTLLSSSGAAARRDGVPSRPAPFRATARPCLPARGLLRAALCALALVTLMCGLVAPVAAQWTPTVTPGDRQLTVEWTDPGISSNFVIEYRLGTSGAWTQSPYVYPPTASYVITGLTNGQSYQVRVVAADSFLGNVQSIIVSAASAAPPAATVPAKPANFAAAAGNAEVALSWDNPNDATITSWQVRRKTTGGYGLVDHHSIQQLHHHQPHGDEPDQRHALHLPGAGGERDRRRGGVQ